MVRISTCGGAVKALQRRVASMPPITGIRTSINTTSGRVRAASRRPAPVRGRADHLDVRLGVRAAPEAQPDHGLVVDDQHLHVDTRTCTGRTASTVKPVPLGPVCKVPPSIHTRSRIPIRPKPDPAGWVVTLVAPLSRTPDDQRVGSVVQLDADGPAGGVAPGIGQCLLDDPVGAASCTDSGTSRALDSANSTWAPAARTCSIRASTSRRLGWGAWSAGSQVRGDPRTVRNSERAVRAWSAISSKARSAEGDRSGIEYRAVEARTAINET